MASSRFLSAVQKFYATRCVDNFQAFMAKCRIIDTQEGRVRIELDVAKEHTNAFGTLHGGCTATMVDTVTTSALVATSRGEPGVSVDLAVSYLAAANLGETVVVEGSVIKLGKSLAFTRADVFRKSDNKLLATGLHTKALPPPAKNN